MKEVRTTARLYRFFYQNESYPNLADNIAKLLIIGFIMMIVGVAAAYYIPMPDVIEGLPALVFIILILGGSLLFIIGGIITLVILYIAWLYTRGL